MGIIDAITTHDLPLKLSGQSVQGSHRDIKHYSVFMHFDPIYGGTTHSDIKLRRFNKKQVYHKDDK